MKGEYRMPTPKIDMFHKSIITDDYQSFSKMLTDTPNLAQQYDLYNEINTPLHIATCHNRVQMVADLLAADAPPDSLNLKHQTPLMIAAESGHAKIVELLIDKGAKTKDIDGVAPLCQAAFYGHEKIVDLLLKGGADPNETTKDGKNALHHATMSSYLSDQSAARICQQLHQAGTDPHHTDNNGQKPEDVARSPKRKAVIEKLAFGIDTEKWRERQIAKQYPRGFLPQ